MKKAVLSLAAVESDSHRYIPKRHLSRKAGLIYRTKWPPRHIETLFSPIPLHRTACIGASRMNKIIKN